MSVRSRVFSVLGHFKPQCVSTLGRFDLVSFRSRVCSIPGHFDTQAVYASDGFDPFPGLFGPVLVRPQLVSVPGRFRPWSLWSWIISVQGRLGHELFRFRVFLAHANSQDKLIIQNLQFALITMESKILGNFANKAVKE